LAYSFITGIVEAHSGYNHHTKSGKLFMDKNLSEKSHSLFKLKYLDTKRNEARG